MNRGEYNYISVAYDVRGKQGILPITVEVVTPTESLDDCDANDLLGLEVPIVVQLQYSQKISLCRHAICYKGIFQGVV